MIAVAVLAGLILAALIAATIGRSVTVSNGGQFRACGEDIGVNVSAEGVHLMGIVDDPLTVGDRLRVSPMCTIRVTSMQVDETEELDPEDVPDGGGARATFKVAPW